MTSNLTGALYLFKSKIESAVNLVPSMNADDKLQAINFWNFLSEKLQDIVNHSAVDINNALEIQRENDNIKDVFDSTAAQNEKELNDNLESLIEENNDILKTTSLTEDQLIFDNNRSQLMNDNLNNNLNNNLTNLDSNMTGNLSTNLPSSLTSNLPSNLSNNLSANINLPNDLNNLTQQDANQFMNSNTELNLEDISNFTNNLELNEQEIIGDSQMKINSTQTMHKDLFNFDQFQGENMIRTNSSEKQSNCDLELNNQNIPQNILQAIAPNSNDSGFISCNSNGCVDSHHLTTSNLVNTNNAYMNNQLNDKPDLLLSDTRNNIRNNGLSLSSTANLTPTTSTNLIASDHLVSNENKDDKNKNRSKGKYGCDKCNSFFSTKGNLITHSRRHSGEKPYRCEIEECGSSFSTKGNLKRHIKAHSGEKPFACDVCTARFTEKKSLKVHIRRHTGERPYQCSLCSKRFSQTGVLQTHMTLHSDERKFLCLICSKKFRQKSQLRLHQLRHEGVKKWSCSNCSSKFLTKGDLQRHTLIHSNERPFKCGMCTKTFTRQQSLNEHKNRSHFYIAPYTCGLCEKRFVEMSSCYKHIKIHKQRQQTADNVNLTNDANKRDEQQDSIFKSQETSQQEN